MARLTKSQTEEIRSILRGLELSESQIESNKIGYGSTTLNSAIGELSNFLISNGFQK